MTSALRLPLSGPGAPDQGVARGNALLQELLVELALTLLPRGMTPRGFSALSRYAFACAAARMARRQNGKVNQSRVAALTGLSRADVKRLLLDSDSGVRAVCSNQTPVERVLHGWRADRRFVDRRGQPKRLRISGTASSFAFLAKQYGGDVPHRAVLDELSRMGAVRRDGRTVELKTTRALRQRHSFASLALVLPALIDGIRLASTPEVSRAPPFIYRLTLPANTELDAAIMRERCSSSVASMLNGLEESLAGQLTVPKRKKGRQPCSFTVTVLLVENGTKGSVKDSSVRALRAPKRA